MKPLALAIAASMSMAFGCTDGDATSQPDALGSDSCRSPTTHYDTGYHNPGQDCRGACHDHGFTISGTLFDAKDCVSPVAGATITVVDADQHVIDLVTMQNGNFYSMSPVAYPVSPMASSCPTLLKMKFPMSQAAASAGGCSQASCHSATSTAGCIHLP